MCRPISSRLYTFQRETACLGLAATQSMLENAFTFASTAKTGCQIHSVYAYGDSKLMPSVNLN